MAGGESSQSTPSRRRRAEPLRAATGPTPRHLPALHSRPASAFAIALIVVAGATVGIAASSDGVDRSGEPAPARAIDAADVSIRTETSAPRVEAASAAGAPAVAAQPLSPVGGLGAITATDGVPSTGGYTDLIRSYFGPLTVEAIVIVQCESNFDPLAVGENTNGTRDHGLFQINDVHMATFEVITGRPWSDIYDPEVNTSFAKWLHGHAGGWGPWRCNRNLEAFQTEPEAGADAGAASGE